MTQNQYIVLHCVRFYVLSNQSAINTMIWGAERSVSLTFFPEGEKGPLKPGSDGRQESLSRRDFHSFSPLIAVTRGENE